MKNQNMNEMKVIHDLAEIERCLREAHLKNDQVTLWQNQGLKRVVQKVFIDAVNPNMPFVDFCEYKNGLKHDFDEDLPFYFNFNHRNLTFKRHVVFLNQTSMRIEFPVEVYASELRTNPRRYLGPSSQIQVKLEKLDHSNLPKTKFDFPIFDISRGGISIVVPPEEMNFFYDKDKIALGSMGIVKFPRPFMAKVVYMKNVQVPLHSRNVRFQKMGIQFSEKIGANIVETISQL